MRNALLPSILLLALVAGAADVRAQAAPQVGSCTLGRAESSLDVNNVFGVVFNTGSLFYGGSVTNGDGYLVPKASNRSPIYASGLWVGGTVGGQLRVAAARYSNFNFWPGPLDAATGRPVNPNNCTAYDRIYRVSKTQIANYVAGAGDIGDVVDWPFQLGAPVIDGDGNPNNYNLDGGDRPDIIGDQSVWWVMNDVGNTHAGTNTPPLGIEVQVQGFAFARADALGSTTFYKYKIINKSGAAINNTYVSIFSDPDLGNATDDYVGSDPELGFGFVYNAENDDEGAIGYGIAPPAIGYDFFQGPIVPDGPDAGSDPDTLGLTAFSYFINGSSAATTGDPSLGTQIYRYMQGLWGDGTEMRTQGDGYNQTGGNVTKFAFPGDPVTNQAWSEINNGTATPVNAKGDRRLVVHTGPFTLNNGDAQDIVFGLVYARGNSNLGSITALRASDRLAQRAYDINFDLPSPPPAPALCDATNPALQPGSGNCLEITASDRTLTLTYGYPSNSPNFLGRYEVIDKFIQNQGNADTTYNFEGFNIYTYPNSNFSIDERRLVATYDIVNGVTEVRDDVFDPNIGANNTAILARGTDSGLQYSYTATNLTNFTDYYYGVTAYAVSPFSSPKVIESQVTQITGRPSGLTSGVRTQGIRDSLVTTTVIQQNGQGDIRARIVDPTLLTGNVYRVTFFNTPSGSLNYSLVNTTTNTTILDGAEFYAQNGTPLPQRADVVVADGLSFSITGPPPDVEDIVEVDKAGEEHSLIAALNTERPPVYLIGVQGSAANDPGSIDINSSMFGRLDFNDYLAASIPNNYEVRWVEPAQGQAILNRSAPTAAVPARYLTCYEIGRAGSNAAATAGPFDLQIVPATVINGIPRLPFQFWEVRPDGTERQVHMNVLDTDGDNCYSFDNAANTGAAPFSGFGYERFYGSKVPYVESELANVADVYARSNVLNGATQAFGRLSVIFRTGPATLPQAGTRLRIKTTKPNQPGDTFEITTAPESLTEVTPEGQEAALDRIAAVPNPYLAQSSYETGNLSNIVRFTNLPEQATTIRIYTVSGSLVNTLRKDGAARSLDWNLQSSQNLPVASGMYLVHVDVDGVGERTLKLGIISRRPQITVF